MRRDESSAAGARSWCVNCMTSMRKCLDELDDNERRRVKRIVIEFEPEEGDADADSDEELDDSDDEGEEDTD